jgi:16S rRNA (guanine(527)-N(7))-methyltransferase RsmG
MLVEDFFKIFPDVPRGTFEVITNYLEILFSWNNKINLISKKDIDNIWERHILNCAQLINFINREKIICDVGSGNGLPGIILAIMSHHKIILIENRQQRVNFLLDVCAQLKLTNVTIIHKDVRKLKLKSDNELNTMLNDLRDKSRELKFKVAQRQLKNLRQIREVKMTIAQILTILKQKQTEIKK